jgi:hypothetical protein
MAHFNTMNQRKKDGTPNDEWITPQGLVEKQIALIPAEEGDCWFDPFKNSGKYYNAFPTDNKVYTELLEGKDFFEFDEDVDIVCSNPPYSMWDAVYDKTIALDPRVVSFVMAKAALTRPRMNKMEDAGYQLTHIHQFDVKAPTPAQVAKGYGRWMTSLFVQWEKSDETPFHDCAFSWDTEPYPFEEKSEDYHEEAKEFRDMLYQMKNYIAIHNAEVLEMKALVDDFIAQSEGA